MRPSLAGARARAIPLATLPLLLALAVAPAAAQQGTRAREQKPATKRAQKPAPKPAPKPTPKPAARPAPKPVSTPKPAAQQPATPASKPAVAAPASMPAAAAAGPRRDTLPADARRAARGATMREGPEGRVLATLSPGAVVTPLVREGGWVRVRMEAWVHEEELLPADTTMTSQLAAADLRADPEGTRGRTVRWEVELLAFQVADALRRELAPDEPYLLVRGPGEENAMLYLALPPSLVTTARGLPPLTRLLVTARVRSGRSAPAGLPVLDLLTLTPLRRS